MLHLDTGYPRNIWGQGYWTACRNRDGDGDGSGEGYVRGCLEGNGCCHIGRDGMSGIKAGDGTGEMSGYRGDGWSPAGSDCWGGTPEILLG